MTKNKSLYSTICILILTLYFIANRLVPFMMDDFWYSTNLVTGESLRNFSDIIESQIWHYNNWGGRSIAHAVLQLTLMSGEMIADLLNVVAFFLMSFIASLFIKKEGRLFSISFIISIVILTNPDIFHSMLWQAGTVNYVYSTCWILMFLYIYIHCIENPEAEYSLVYLWIIPLGLITGWSNENMGPACFVLSVSVILYLYKKYKLIKPWMVLGSVACLIGSSICILAPGNFVRSEFVEEGSLITIIKTRTLTMLDGTCDFLGPSVVILLLIIGISYYVGLKLQTSVFFILGTAVLAFGAMALSPHFPARASFGSIVLINLTSARVLLRVCEKSVIIKKWTNVAIATMAFFAIIKLFCSIGA